MSDDITICASECNNKKCFRHSSNIQEPRYPHSFAMFKDTDTCPMYKKTMTLDEAISHLQETLSDSTHKWSCAECREEHEQLAEWLTELKERREAENEQ